MKKIYFKIIKVLKLNKKICAFFLVTLVLYCYARYIEPNYVRITKYYINNSNFFFKNEKIKIIFAADFHCGIFFSVERVKDTVKKINDCKPDLILLGGDYIDRDKKFIEPCIEELSLLKAKYGVYAVLGNHDCFTAEKKISDTINKTGIKLITNRGEWIHFEKGRLRICGVGDFWEQNQDLKKTLDIAGKNDYVILLNHNPDYVNMIGKSDLEKIDIILCGHTHAGQVTLFGVWAPVINTSSGTDFLYGKKRINTTDVITTSGLGTAIYPLRFFAQPEIVQIEVCSSEIGFRLP